MDRPHLRIPTLDTLAWVAIAVVVVVGITLVVWLFRGTTITVNNGPGPSGSQGIGLLTGLACPDPSRRPIAVMLASDPEARPLSGIGEADMVFEMPVTPNGITRTMGVFQCQDPKEIGSIRSARQDFIPLAQGLGALFVHWGGERDALDRLNTHVIDNVDALLYEGTTFYRKNAVPRPHNGFSTLTLIRQRAAELGYAASASMTPYPRIAATGGRNLNDAVETVTVPWPQGMDVRFTYDTQTDTYLRWRGGQPEMDVATGQQVRVAVVVVIQTDASFLRDQYISVRTTGKGIAAIYQDGRRISALWKKQGPADPLVFTDSQGKLIPLVRGNIWVIINAPLPAAN